MDQLLLGMTSLMTSSNQLLSIGEDRSDNQQ